MENNNQKKIINAEISTVLQIQKDGLRKATEKLLKYNEETYVGKAKDTISAVANIVSDSKKCDEFNYLSARAQHLLTLLESKSSSVGSASDALLIFASELESYLA